MAFRRWMVTALACAALTGCGSAVAAPPLPPPVEAPSLSPSPTNRAPAVTFPQHGTRKWTVAAAQTGNPSGRTGKLWRYRVQIERGITGVDVTAFAATVQATFDDPRGWTAGNRRFERVGPGDDADFIVHLATPDTKDAMCGGAPDGYTSCRNGANVMLNVARWAHGVPGFGKNLTLYRTYMINHEVGHRLGYGHVRCPGPGRPAPVMQQQTLGLHGCTPQPWPYPKGKLYQGPPGVYDDKIPAA